MKRPSFLTFRITLLGILSWLVPFVFSAFFYVSSGELQMAKPLFKSMMMVIFGGLGAALLLLAFRKVEPTLMSGLRIGLYWLALNWILDIGVLLPLSGLGIWEYMADIGLRYLMIPIMGAAMGAVGQRRP